MKNKIILFILFLGFAFAACTDMNDVSKEFLTNEIRYSGSPDTIKVLAGRERIILNFRITDASVNVLKIFWNNKSDSIIMPIVMDVVPKTFNVEIPGLSQGSYSFEIITYDKKGNKSIVSRATGKVYGDAYHASLLNTPLKAYLSDQLQPAQVEAVWGSPDLTALGMDFIYTNTLGEPVTLFVEVPKAENILFESKMQIADYLAGSKIKYRTYYLPEKTAVDTFVTAYAEIPVKGFAQEYDRSYWMIEANYDLGNPRPPQNLLDGNTSTVWHMDKTLKYPHSAIVDMGDVYDISGFMVQQRSPITTPAKAIAFRVSIDKIKWTSVGEFTMSNTTTGKQYFDLMLETRGRYFELIVKSDYNNGGSTALAELNAYKR
ncbi:MAG: DUF4998 domain-containing protein [Paludibacter sp.]|jgi:hypothetical protein|nr:DUF4998 domain-containing protein [Paludibacter sp.]